MTNDPAALCVRLAAVVLAVSAVEVLIRSSAYAPGGLLDWRALRYVRSKRSGRTGPLVGRLLDRTGATGLRFLQWLQLILAAVVWWRPLAPPVLLGLITTQVINMRRHPQSNDGSDDMALIVITSVALGLIFDSLEIALVFLAGQAALSYFVSGVSKVPSDSWWSGEALAGVTGTMTFGRPSIGRLPAEHARVATVASRSMVIWEVMWPIAIIAPRPIAIGFVATGCAFHATCALVMGLNTFVWAFAATYPALLAVNAWARGEHTPATNVLTVALVSVLAAIVILIRGVHRSGARSASIAGRA